MMLGGWPAWRGRLGILWCVADLERRIALHSLSLIASARMASIVHVSL